MSLLDNDIELFDETDILKGFPNKKDWIYEIYGYSNYSDTNDNYSDANDQANPDLIPMQEIFRYRCTNPLITEKEYMPYGFDIIATANKSYSNCIKRDFNNFRIQIISINYNLIKNCGMNLFLGTIPYKYKDKIQDILYELVQKIINDIHGFLEITDKYHYSSLYDQENNKMIRNFFKIDDSLIFGI